MTDRRVSDDAAVLFAQRRLRIVEGPHDVVLHGSDIRVQGARGTCALCRTPGPLQLSHIAPRWAYRWIKAEGRVLGSVKTLGVEYAEQDGNKHYLLCSACEQHLGTAEAYLALLTRGRVDELALRGITLKPGPLLDGVDSNLVRRGVLGVLFKGHFAASPPFTQVVLASPLLESLRRRLIADDYPVNAYPLIAIKWMGCIIEGANPRAYMVPAFRAEPGQVSFDLMLGGWSWTVILKGQTHFTDMLPPACNLAPGQPWHVMLGDLSISNWVDPEQTGAGYEVDPWLDYPRDKPCPCGLSEYTFGTCCADTWCATDEG